MKAYAFRFISARTGEPTGYIGFAVSKNKRELFWEIDQYGDPWSVEIQKLTDCSFCFNQGLNVGLDEPSEFEYSESLWFLCDEEWKRPKWPLKVLYRD